MPAATEEITQPRGATRPRESGTPRLVGPVLGGLCAAASLLGLVLASGPGGRSLGDLMADNVLNNAVNGVTLGALGAVLTGMRPANRLGWLILLVAWGNGLALLGEGWALASYEIALPGRHLLAWLGSWVWAPALLAGPSLVALLYPTGRTSSPYAHRLAVTAAGAAATVGASLALLDASYSGAVPGHDLGVNPISRGHLQLPLAVLAGIAAVVGLVIAVAAWVDTLRRLWRAESPEREQLAWLLAMIAPLLVVAPLDLPVLTFTVQVLSPVGLAVGVVRHQLFDIKLVLRSGLVYSVLTGVAVAIYFGLVALITTVTPRGAVPSLFAIAAVGLVVVPAHRGLQGFFGRLVYGDRADPLRALSRVAEGIRARDADDPSGMRPMLAAVARALRSPYVALEGLAGEPLASIGSAEDHPLHVVDLEYAGERVGRLVVAGRTPRDPLGSADRRLLEALSVPVAGAVKAGFAARELADSRSRVLATREGERRRLREDLHDGLGPSLSGVALGLEAARRSVATHPDRVPEILEVLHAEVDSLVTEVRSIIDDLGPGDVDLRAAVRMHVDAVRASGAVEVELAESGDLGGVPGEVAVAAHRIAGEALSNAVRHAQAGRVSLTLASHTDHLVVEVVDDGVGTVGPRPGGVGLESMRQRAESVGGRLTVAGVPGKGTTVRSVLPWQVTP